MVVQYSVLTVIVETTLKISQLVRLNILLHKTLSDAGIKSRVFEEGDYEDPAD
jgi:hypothetical protein